MSIDTGGVIAVKKLWPSTHTTATVTCKADNSMSGRVQDSFSVEVRTLGSI